MERPLQQLISGTKLNITNPSDITNTQEKSRCNKDDSKSPMKKYFNSKFKLSDKPKDRNKISKIKHNDRESQEALNRVFHFESIIHLNPKSRIFIR